MKETFETFGEQMTVINRFLNNMTDVKLNCQYCGNKGRIKHNKQEPYKIQIICTECAKAKHINTIKNKDNMLEDIPLINLKEHVINKSMLNKMKTLDEEAIKILQDLLNTKEVKKDAIKNTGYTMTVYNRLVDEYTEKYDKDYKIKLEQVFKQNLQNRIKQSVLERHVYTGGNNYSKLKLEKGLTNREILKLIHNQVGLNCLCLIQENKVNPTIQTKCALAQAFGVSVRDIFPEETEFGEVYNWNDYWFDIRNWFINTIDKYVNTMRDRGQKKVIKNLAYKMNMTTARLYAFRNRSGHPTNEEIKQLKSIINNENIMKE